MKLLVMKKRRSKETESSAMMAKLALTSNQIPNLVLIKLKTRQSQVTAVWTIVLLRRQGKRCGFVVIQESYIQNLTRMALRLDFRIPFKQKVKLINSKPSKFLKNSHQ